MKTVIAWLSSPYIHIFVAGTILVRVLMAAGGAEPNDESDSMISCVACKTIHDAGRSCPQIAVRVRAPHRER
jgi:hypothetical protein